MLHVLGPSLKIALQLVICASVFLYVKKHRKMYYKFMFICVLSPASVNFPIWNTQQTFNQNKIEYISRPRQQTNDFCHA